jgi:hypothetical protein
MGAVRCATGSPHVQRRFVEPIGTYRATPGRLRIASPIERLATAEAASTRSQTEVPPCDGPPPVFGGVTNNAGGTTATGGICEAGGSAAAGGTRPADAVEVGLAGPAVEVGLAGPVVGELAAALVADATGGATIAQVEREIVLVSIVTAPFRASARPATVVLF